MDNGRLAVDSNLTCHQEGRHVAHAEILFTDTHGVGRPDRVDPRIIGGSKGDVAEVEHAGDEGPHLIELLRGDADGEEGVVKDRVLLPVVVVVNPRGAREGEVVEGLRRQTIRPRRLASDQLVQHVV